MVKVNLNGNWRFFLDDVPVGTEVLGVVTDEFGKRGALVRTIASGVYALMHGDVTSALDQHQVEAALPRVRSAAIEPRQDK